MTERLIHAVRTALGSERMQISSSCGEVDLVVQTMRIADVLEILRDDAGTAMNQLVDLCGADFPALEKRFDVVYQLLSLKHNWRLRVRVEVGEDEPVPSVTDVYPSAGWFERETFDLYGIVFDGHPDLRRILTDYDFEGHPLRRDFPLTGFTQVRFDDLHKTVVKEPVALEQDYRAFDASSPWQGVTDIQRRGRGKA
jgi:NADH-quinone oxidoreductase subunit C